MRQNVGRGSKQSSKQPSDASDAVSQRASKDIPAFAEFDRPTRRGSLAVPVAPRRADNPADDVRRPLFPLHWFYPLLLAQARTSCSSVP